jgi:hypothetical protein
LAGGVSGRSIYFMIENIRGQPITYTVEVTSR